MLDSTFELIGLAVSDSLMIFCFCNLIIAILLVPQLNPRKPRAGPTILNDGNLKKSTSVSLCGKKMGALVEAGELSSVSISMVENEDKSPDEKEEENDDHDDDELRRRVEEFIEKINKGWRAEKVNF